jgi:peptide methionine sulfoxide reductase MsrB
MEREVNARTDFICIMKGTEPPFSGKYYRSTSTGLTILHKLCFTREIESSSWVIPKLPMN